MSFEFKHLNDEEYTVKVEAARKNSGKPIGIAVTVGHDKRIYLRTIDVGGTEPAVCRLTAEQAQEIADGLLRSIEKSTGDFFAE